MNRAMRRAGQHGKGPLADLVCEHGNVMKTDGTSTPMCPHGCGFHPANEPGETNPQVGNDVSGAETIEPANDVVPWSFPGALDTLVIQS